MTWLIAFLFWVCWKYAVNQLDMLLLFSSICTQFHGFRNWILGISSFGSSKRRVVLWLIVFSGERTRFYYSVGYLVLLGIWSVHGKPVYSVW